MSTPEDDHLALQAATQATSEDIVALIKERLAAFRRKHEALLGDSLPPPAPRTCLRPNHTLSRIRNLEASKMAEMKSLYTEATTKQ